MEELDATTVAPPAALYFGFSGVGQSQKSFGVLLARYACLSSFVYDWTKSGDVDIKVQLKSDIFTFIKIRKAPHKLI